MMTKHSGHTVFDLLGVPKQAFKQTKQIKTAADNQSQQQNTEARLL